MNERQIEYLEVVFQLFLIVLKIFLLHFVIGDRASYFWVNRCVKK